MKTQQKYYYKAKFIILGEAGVGKTNLLHRFAKGEFNNKYAITLGMDFLCSNVEEDGKLFKLELWDTAGSEKFRSITKGYFKNSTCALIVYDITRKSSFLKLDNWIEECKNNSANKNINLILIGNKLDLNDCRQVEKDEGKNAAENNGMAFYEASALTGENVDNIFFDACKALSKDIDEGKYDFDDESYGLKRSLMTSLDVNTNKRTLSRFQSNYSMNNTNNNMKKKVKCC